MQLNGKAEDKSILKSIQDSKTFLLLLSTYKLILEEIFIKIL